MKLIDQLRRTVNTETGKKGNRTMEQVANAAGMHVTRLRSFANGTTKTLTFEHAYDLGNAVGLRLGYTAGPRRSVSRPAAETTGKSTTDGTRSVEAGDSSGEVGIVAGGAIAGTKGRTTGGKKATTKPASKSGKSKKTAAAPQPA